jgi:hypothetical protein
MFASQDDDQPKTWVPYIVGMAATAILSTLGSKLVEWGVDELRSKYGSKNKTRENPFRKKEKGDDKEGVREGGSADPKASP